MLRKLISFLFLVLLLTSNASAAGNIKIAVIDFKEFMAQSAIGESIQKEIKDKGEELKSELKKMQNELKELQEKFRRESTLWTKEQKQEKERSFSTRLNDFNRFKIEKEKEYASFKSEKINAAQKQIIEYAKKKAKEEKYDLVFEKNTGTIIYADESINITDEVIKDFDSK